MRFIFFLNNFFNNIIYLDRRDYERICEIHDNCFEYDFSFFEHTYNSKKLPPLETLNGMKLLRAFKFFISDPDVLRDLQDKASMILQETKLSGYFYVSIHPLDYLSQSETTYNWRSCHALDGEYRAGTLSYMQDNVSLVCYIASDEKKQLPRFPAEVPWYSKKWRMMLHRFRLTVCM